MTLPNNGDPDGSGVVVAPALLAPARPVPVPVTAVDKLVKGGACLLLGWSLAESTGAATAQVSLWDGQDATGVLVAALSLAAGGESTRPLPDRGVWLQAGAFLHVVSGSVTGSLWLVF